MGGAVSDQVEEDGTSCASFAGMQIIVEDDQRIIGAVDAGKLLVAFGVGQADGPIVVPVPYFIAPAIERLDRLLRQARDKRHSSVRPLQQLHHAKCPTRACAIAFALPAGQTGLANETKKYPVPDMQPRHA